MYTCPKCYKLFRDKIGICSKCGFDCSNYETKVREKAASRKGDGGKAEIKRLKEIIQDLKQRERLALASRDKWKRRAVIAETRQNDLSQASDRKFKKAKRIFSKMYHPDSATGDRFEKLIKQEIFKEYWQVIQKIEDDNT